MSLHVLLLIIRQNQKKIKSLLTNKNNKIIYDKKKDFSQITHDITVSSVLNDPSFFDNSIHQNEPVVNTSEEKVSEMRKYDIVDSELNADGKIKDEYKLREV